MRHVEDQVMVTKLKDEDQESDPLVNAATRTLKDHNEQSYEDQESNPLVIAAAVYSTDHNPLWCSNRGMTGN